MHQCAGSKRNHQSLQQPSINNASEELNRNPNPILGLDMLMSSFNDTILPITPLKELKTEDLDILEIPVSSQNEPQIQQSKQWPQNMQYIPNGSQFGIPKNHMMPRNGQADLTFNPLQQQQQQQQQFRTGLYSQFLYHTN